MSKRQTKARRFPSVHAPDIPTRQAIASISLRVDLLLALGSARLANTPTRSTARASAPSIPPVHKRRT